MRQIIWSTCISLALHAGLLALPAGGMGEDVSRPAPAKPAVLTLTLAPNPLQLANALPILPVKPLPHPPRSGPPAFSPPEMVSESAREESPEDTLPAESTTGPGLPVPLYHELNELSRPAEILDDPDFNLPEINAFKGAGQSVMSIFINETGLVDQVTVEDSSIDETLTHALALQFSKGIFQPAMINGVAVKSRLRIEILVRP